MPDDPVIAVQDTTVDLESLEPVLEKAFEAAGIRRRHVEQQQQQQEPQPEQQPEQQGEPEQQTATAA